MPRFLPAVFTWRINVFINALKAGLQNHKVG